MNQGVWQKHAEKPNKSNTKAVERHATICFGKLRSHTSGAKVVQ
jgi:hypothetical protein